MRTRLVDVAMARHARNGRDEMERLRDEFLALAATSKVAMPVARALYGRSPSEGGTPTIMHTVTPEAPRWH